MLKRQGQGTTNTSEVVITPTQSLHTLIFIFLKTKDQAADAFLDLGVPAEGLA